MYIFNPGGDCHMKGSGVLVGSFELNLLGRPTWAWAILLLIPKRDKFQPTGSWLNKRSMSCCVTTEMWWPVYVEGEGLFCLLCKKKTRLILKTSRKFLTRSPVNDFAQRSLKIVAVRHNIWTQFQRRCCGEFPCFKEPLTNRGNSHGRCAVEDVHSCVLDHEKELPNHKIKLYVSQRAYMYSRLVAT